MLNVALLNVIIMSAVKLSAIILNGVMLNVAAPETHTAITIGVKFNNSTKKKTGA